MAYGLVAALDTVLRMEESKVTTITAINNIEVCREITEKKSCRYIKYEGKDDFEHPSVKTLADFSEHDIEAGRTGGWCLIDMQSANAVVTVYDALSEKNQVEFNSYPIQWMVDTAWDLIAKSNA